MPIPTMTTPRLTLRPFSEEDAPALQRILGVEGVLRYFPSPDPPTLERVQRFIAGQLKQWQEHGLGWWAVEPRAEKRLIGWNGLQYLPETGETEVGFLLDKAYWGQGLATEGARVGLLFGFDTLKLEQIIALVHPENEASQRVIAKLGMPLVERTQYFGMDVYRYVLSASAFRVQRS